MEERIILETKPSWIILIPHLIGMIVIVGIFTIWGAIIKVLTTRLKVTNKRVEGKAGLIKTETMDSRLKQITSVKVEQELIGKIFNYGQININTANGYYEFKYIPNPNKVRETINREIDKVEV